MRLIIETGLADLEFAVRAARWAAEQPYRDAIVSYRNEGGPDLWVKQNKKSLSIREVSRSAPDK